MLGAAPQRVDNFSELGSVSGILVLWIFASLFRVERRGRSRCVMPSRMA